MYIWTGGGNMQKKPSYELIAAAVNGDQAAMEQILKIYEPYIKKASGGNEDLRQHIFVELIASIKNYDLSTPDAVEQEDYDAL